ncbi:MAG: flavin reductase family protein [Planctomycetota bacterium]|nr:flavin reductase family protein [Planctomycetota bacterium]
MQKKKTGPTTGIFPMPCAIVSTGISSGERNIATVSYVGVVNGQPPMVSISLRPSRHSHGKVISAEVFGINIPTIDMLPETDLAGTISGKDQDKFEKLGLTPFFGEETDVALIAECPINLECKLSKTIELPTHTVFIGRVMQTYLDDEYVIDGKLALAEGKVPCYGANNYWAVGKNITALRKPH